MDAMANPGTGIACLTVAGLERETLLAGIGAGRQYKPLKLSLRALAASAHLSEVHWVYLPMRDDVSVQ